MKVRKAVMEDVPEITRLCFQLGYPTIPEQVSANLKALLGDEEHGIFVVEQSGRKVIGWVHGYVYKLLYNEPSTQVAGLVVDEGSRSKGAGKALMSAVEAWSREKGCVVIGLRSNIIRKEAHIFYKNLGYEIIKESYTFSKKL
ncbi:MAG: GNAT family N-acetyltransferase [Pseudomonadota bacterium]